MDEFREMKHGWACRGDVADPPTRIAVELFMARAPPPPIIIYIYNVIMIIICLPRPELHSFFLSCENDLVGGL